MSPTIVAGDWVVVSTWRPATQSSIERGDIVLFRYPTGSSGRAVKRVAAKPGDQVESGPGGVRVNGKDAGLSGGPATGEILRVPEGYFYLVGDNLNSSVDSRSLGPIPESEVVGVVSLVIGFQ